MTKFMYRGQHVLKEQDVTVRFGDIVDESHIGIQRGWPGFVPVRNDPGKQPEAAAEATSVEADEDFGSDIFDLGEI